MEAKGRTTYNEVADELVAEMSRIEMANKNGQYDEKNIRRRVYDAINVLMAMDIIQKEKKEILWKGFPKLSHNSLDKLKAERLAKIKEVEQKQLYLQVRRAGVAWTWRSLPAVCPYPAHAPVANDVICSACVARAPRSVVARRLGLPLRSHERAPGTYVPMPAS